MKLLPRILPIAIALVACGAHASSVPTTAGDNLTAFNSNNGLGIGNNWNAMVSGRSSAANAPEANFGNCNAIIMRCATPKCSSGGCTDMTVASSIVAGCVASKEECQQYGDELVNYIAAQLVANSTAKANQIAADAQNSAAQMAAQQSAQQIQQMQQQMQQMQQDMAAQNQATVAQLQNALEEQKQIAAQAQAAAVAQATNPTNVSDAQINAAQNGVSSDILVREQISGQILSKIENAETQLKTLKAAMKTTFDYAGCDTSGNNCKGPKRVKKFKQQAMEFFDPYENVLDEIYDALILAQTVGVDLTDIYLMLNNTCNVWGQYLCSEKSNSTINIEKEVKDGKCRLIKLLKDEDEIKASWLYPEQTTDKDGASIRLACASEALNSSALFRNRKKESNIDIETLKRIIEQDSVNLGRNKKSGNDIVKYCAITEYDYNNLLKYTISKKLPDKDVCINEIQLSNNLGKNYINSDSSFIDSIIDLRKGECKSPAIWSDLTLTCYCEKTTNEECDFLETDNKKTIDESILCDENGQHYDGEKCFCKNNRNIIVDRPDKFKLCN